MASRQLAFASLILFLIACTSTTNGGKNTSSSTTTAANEPVSQSECESRCTKRARQCEATPDQVDAICGDVCSGSLDEAQLDCLEAKPCPELASGKAFAELCPKDGTDNGGGSGGGAAFGEACTCPDASATGSGLCSQGCSGGGFCKYDSGSGGKGTCIGGPCCTKTSACDEDSSLLTSCKQGTCTKTNMGYFCMP